MGIVTGGSLSLYQMISSRLGADLLRSRLFPIGLMELFRLLLSLSIELIQIRSFGSKLDCLRRCLIVSRRIFYACSPDVAFVGRLGKHVGSRSRDFNILRPDELIYVGTFCFIDLRLPLDYLSESDAIKFENFFISQSVTKLLVFNRRYVVLLASNLRHHCSLGLLNLE